jgi:GNAT superfamily N-acetyltransferase
VARVRRIRPNDVALLRVLRLRALETDPVAFASTFEHELAYGDEWADWCERHARGGDEATFFAISEDGEPAGLAGGFRAADGTYELFSMWVAPEHRRAGHAGRLVEAIAAWAGESGGGSLALWVTDPGALAFYERTGFRDDGRRESLPHTAAVTMLGMSRPLRSS